MNELNAAGGYGPPGSGGGWGPPGGGYGAPPTPPAPPAGGYGAPPGGGHGSPPAVGFVPPSPLMPGAGGDVNTTLPLLLNVFALIFCGATLFALPLSITGIVFALQAKGLEGRGDVLGARDKAKLSTKLFFGSLAIGVLLLVIWQWLAPTPRH